MGATVNTTQPSDIVDAITGHLFPHEYKLSEAEGEIVIRRAPAEHHETVVELHVKADCTAFVLSRLLDEDDWSHMWQLKHTVIKRLVERDEETGEITWEESDEAMEQRRLAAVAQEGEIGAGFLR